MFVLFWVCGFGFWGLEEVEEEDYWVGFKLNVVVSPCFRFPSFSFFFSFLENLLEIFLKFFYKKIKRFFFFLQFFFYISYEINIKTFLK